MTPGGTHHGGHQSRQEQLPNADLITGLWCMVSVTLETELLNSGSPVIDSL